MVAAEPTHSINLIIMAAQDLSHHFSRASQKRVANVMKEYYRFLNIPGMGSFAGGSPCPDYFPFNNFEVSTVPSDSLHGLASSSSELGSAPGLSLDIPRAVNATHVSQQICLNNALQYGISTGYPPLYAWLKKLVTTIYHPNIPYNGGADIIICGGAADGLGKAYEVLFNSWDGDVYKVEDREGLLVEEFIYPPVIAQVKHKDVNIVPVKMDHEGFLVDGPGGLRDVLENWDVKKGKRPHVLYSIPTGQNPTSGVFSIFRRKQVYQVCSKYDVIIIEDDPYWNLQYHSTRAMHEDSIDQNKLGQSISHPIEKDHTPKSTGYSFLDELMPSFLNIDTDGRVIRLDTFSKTIAPGCRLGWITAQPQICEQIFRVTDATTQQPSGFVQAIVAKLLSTLDHLDDDKSQQSPMTWGFDGWVHWLEGLRNKYQSRMMIMANIFEQNRFKTTDQGKLEMFSFAWPRGGMFIWLKVTISAHPLASVINPRRLMYALWIFCTQEPYRIIMNPGKDFAADDQIREEIGYLYLRFCFAAVNESILVSKSVAFTEACKDFWDLRDEADIDGILREEDRMRETASGDEGSADVERVRVEDW